MIELPSSSVVVLDVERIAQSKHSVVQALQEGLVHSEICSSVSHPAAEPGSRVRRKAISVGGEEEDAHSLARALCRQRQKVQLCKIQWNPSKVDAIGPIGLL